MPGVFCFGGCGGRTECQGGDDRRPGLPALRDASSVYPVPFCACRRIKYFLNTYSVSGCPDSPSQPVTDKRGDLYRLVEIQTRQGKR